jgi:glutamate transport system ATP-binding protein
MATDAGNAAEHHSRTPGGRGEPLVVLSDVQKHYGDFQALSDIDLTVNRGEVVVVIGPSGSGKSTLCRTINRLETITSGSITIDGKELPKEGRGLANLRADVGMVFQSFNLFAHKTILENVTLGPIKVRGQGKAEAEKHARELLDRVVFMSDGRIVEEATPEEFFTHPKSDRARDFLSKLITH